ncbi:MAG: Holliday junction resolvase RuvX [Bacteroidia bacterium]|nr:Holliday junction resolvase RuvX [Bacteroidia bacterium]
MGRIIAIDWGSKRTGLAWTDPLQMIATRLEGVQTQELKKRLQHWSQTENVDGFLVGFPTRMNGEDTHSTEEVRKFVTELEGLFPGKQIILWDERLTSTLAARALVTAGVPRMKRRNKHLLDEMSATLMLQEYLDHKL